MQVEIQARSCGIEEKSSSFALEASLISELLRFFTASSSAAAEIDAMWLIMLIMQGCFHVR